MFEAVTDIDDRSKTLGDFLREVQAMHGIFRNILAVSGRTSARVAEVVREHGWPPPKSLDSDENFKPEHTLFCRELRFVAIYALFFGDLLA